MFSSFLERNKNISLVNSLSICEGVITRQRTTDILNEKSVLDIFLVCERVLPFVTKMFIDEKRKSPLTNFLNKIRGRRITETDHNKLELYISIKAPLIKPRREEFFNFRTKHGQFLFNNHTSNSKVLKSCFKTERKLEDQALTFKREINNILHQSFQKIRGTKRKRENTEINQLFIERKRIKLDASDPANKNAQNQRDKVDKAISKLISDQNRNKINDLFQSIANADDSCNTLGMWKQVKKIFPKILKSVPSGIKNHLGKIVTKTSSVKQIIMRKYKIRLRKRPSGPGIENIMKIKEENSRRIINLCREVKTPPWTAEELAKVSKSLKNNKCRDPNGLINKLFKPGVIGTDLQIALLDLFNRCKSEMQIPDFMTLSNIVNIWKKKGDKMNIDSYRGIFIINFYKSLILKLIYQDKSKSIDSHMSEYQIGGRKGRNVRDHLFVVNGLIQDTLSSVSMKPLNIIVADFSLCFDGMYLPLACRDLYFSGCKDDKLALLYDINKRNNVAVRTSLGLTDRFELYDNVLQGDVFGNILASNQIDKFGKQCLEEEINIYMYRNIVPIVPMAMCDDLLIISECGYKTDLAVAYLNS